MLETSKKAKLIYYALIVASFLGTIMPIVSQISKLKFKSNLKERLTEHLGSDIFNDLIFWMIDVFPKWHDMNVLASHGMYSFRWSIWRFIILAALIFFRQRALKLVTSLIEIYQKKNIILVAVIFILVTFLSMISLGFWWAGIPGWDFRDTKSQLIPFEKDKFSPDSRRDYLSDSINVDNFKKYVGPGCLENRIVIGFHNEKKYSINDGISGFVRPALFHKFLQSPDINHQEVPWLQIINHRMKKLSNESDFWKKIKYPNHNAYMPLPWDTAGIDGFEKIEHWNVTSCFDGTTVFTSKASLIKTYD